MVLLEDGMFAGQRAQLKERPMSILCIVYMVCKSKEQLNILKHLVSWKNMN